MVMHGNYRLCSGIFIVVFMIVLFHDHYYLQFAPLMKILPSECVYKADQWVMLNRSDTELLLSAPTLLNGLLKEHSVTSNPSDATSILRSLFKKVGH